MPAVATFLGCVACDRYEVDDGRSGPLLCCGLPMYGEEIPIVPENGWAIDLARKKARDWKRRAPSPHEKETR